MYEELSRESAAVSPVSKAESARDWARQRASDKARRAAQASHTSGRRRNVDPTTSDRDYSPEELEFIWAMHEYKRRSGRMFPTWSEVLEVLRSLGYERPEAAVGDAPLAPAAVARPAGVRPVATG